MFWNYYTVYLVVKLIGFLHVTNYKTLYYISVTILLFIYFHTLIQITQLRVNVFLLKKKLITIIIIIWLWGLDFLFLKKNMDNSVISLSLWKYEINLQRAFRAKVSNSSLPELTIKILSNFLKFLDNFIKWGL